MRNLLERGPGIAREEVPAKFEAALQEWLWHINHPWLSVFYDIGRTVIYTVFAQQL